MFKRKLTDGDYQQYEQQLRAVIRPKGPDDLVVAIRNGEVLTGIEVYFPLDDYLSSELQIEDANNYCEAFNDVWFLVESAIEAFSVHNDHDYAA